MASYVSSNSIYSSNFSTIHKGDSGKKPGGPIKLDVDLTAVENKFGGTKVKIETHASSHGGSNAFSLETRSEVKPGPDQLALKLGIGDWAREPGDRDAFDFLICISGAKSSKAPLEHIKNPKDIDVKVDLHLKGGLDVDVKPASVAGLKLVKCKDADGKDAWGYLGQVSDARKLKLVLKSAKTGEKVANLSVDLSHDKDKPDFELPPIWPFVGDIFG
jgi:hypothetical protein